MKKKELRKIYKNKRLEITPLEIDNLSLEIANNLLKLPIWDKKYFHIFLSITELNEVNTEFILHLLAGKDKEILVSKANFATNEMTHFLLTDSTKIVKNKYNIPEPLEGIEVSSDKIEVVIVPLLIFDQTGNRLGYGKGFYDKFLSVCKTDCIKIGLSFFDSIKEIEDNHEKDVKLDFAVTPISIYKF